MTVCVLDMRFLPRYVVAYMRTIRVLKGQLQMLSLYKK